VLDAVGALGVEIESILITHCHFDHIGAVAPIARATGAPVYCPRIEVGVLADIMKWTMPGFGPFESWEAEHTVTGGERMRLADLDIEVVFTPGHSAGHVTYAISAGTAKADFVSPHAPAAGSPAAPDTSGGAAVLLSGDVLFQGSVGRVDLPGGDWATLERSIGTLMERFERETVVYPGHMGVTTLGREWDANPFLSELRAAASAPAPVRAQAVERRVRIKAPRGTSDARRAGAARRPRAAARSILEGPAMSGSRRSRSGPRRVSRAGWVL
jgi:glyoxylase-like metal-dependent hydrolase (beta-lactamase superfamily II)